MARREKRIEIQDRDQKLTFKIREMSATRLESWIMRSMLLLAGSGARMPEGADVGELGAFMAEAGLTALGNIEFEKAAPLLDELLGCCSRIVERVEERCTPESVDAYILDVKTLFTLRMEAIKLNLGFLSPEETAVAGKSSGFPARAATMPQ
jgi:hypothetical protein